MRWAALLLTLAVFAAAPVRGAAETVYLTTVPPIADLLERTVEGRAEVVRLLPGGASPHTYEPRPSDVRTAEGAAAIVYVDSRLDGWAADLPSARSIRLLGLVPDSLLLSLPAEVAPGHGHDHGQDHGHDHAHGGEEDGSPGTDPHFWLDPVAVAAMIPVLAESLAAIDPEGAAVYRRNAARVAASIDSLHQEIAGILAPFEGRPVLLSHPFNRYYLRRYGIREAGVIEIIPGKEPTAKELVRVIRSTRESGAEAIFTLPQLSGEAARAVEEATGIPVRTLDPLGGSPGRETYAEILLGMARETAEALR